MKVSVYSIGSSRILFYTPTPYVKEADVGRATCSLSVASVFCFYNGKVLADLVPKIHTPCVAGLDSSSKPSGVAFFKTICRVVLVTVLGASFCVRMVACSKMEGREYTPFPSIIRT